MTGRWDKKGLPHKGWSCVGMEDRETPESSCEMCGKEEVRYVHLMRHPDFERTLEVGCVCAEKMEGDYEGDTSPARRREAQLRNAAGRRNRFPDLVAWKHSAKGNIWISKDGRRIVIFAKGSRFKFFIEDASGKYFSPKGYPSVREAQLAAFDAFTYQQSS